MAEGGGVGQIRVFGVGIKILKIIGSGDHTVVYRITAGGGIFTLKVVSILTLYYI